MWAETFKYLSLIHKVNHHHCSHQRDWGEGRGSVCEGGGVVKHFYLKAVYTNQIRQNLMTVAPVEEQAR